MTITTESFVGSWNDPVMDVIICLSDEADGGYGAYSESTCLNLLTEFVLEMETPGEGSQISLLVTDFNCCLQYSKNNVVFLATLLT